MPVDLRTYRSLGSTEEPYKQRKRGLGVRNAIKRRTNVTPKSDAFGQMFFRAIIAAAPLTKFPPTNLLIKKVAMLGGTSNTRGHSIPLYLDAADDDPARKSLERLKQAREEDEAVPGTTKTRTIEINKTVAKSIEHIHPPVDLLIDIIKRSTYLASLNECLCRKLQGCTDYPLDIGCLFIGPAARSCVKRGVAKELTVEEAIRHVERAAKAGLSAAAYFVEVEEYVWGWLDEDMPNILEVCFCCPCCCSAVRFEEKAGGELERILHQGIGWSCVVDEDACLGCGACEKACPHDCMRIEKGRARVHESCAGCGQCVRSCMHGALRIMQTGDTKPRIDDYFEKLNWNL